MAMSGLGGWDSGGRPAVYCHNRFSIGFWLGLDGRHSIIFSPVSLLCPKDSRVSLDTREEALSRINTHFTLKLLDWD